MEVKNSITMPKTAFEMRGNLNNKEPLIIEKWGRIDLYNLVMKNNQGKPTYMLHDGPPYANGDIHLGHALNKILKDFIIRYKNMSGFYAPYIPGWDTHGLPIESVLAKKGINRKELDLVTYRNMCRDYALEQVEKQKGEFKRLGGIGDYDNPYITLKKEYEAHQIEVFSKMALDGLVYKGAKPVYWSPSSESSLAEAEIEYYDVTSTSIYVAFKVKNTKGVLNGDESFIIWTTTPWTMPANLAICLNPDFEYGVYETEKGVFVFLNEFATKLQKELELGEMKLRKTFVGKELEYITYSHPLYGRDSIIILGDHVTNDAGTGCVHTAPGHGEDDYNVGKQYGLDILCPVDEKGYMMKECGPELEGMFYEQANSKVLEMLAEKGALLKATPITHSYPHDWRTKKPIIFRVTPQWFVSIEPIKDKILNNIKNVKWYTNWAEVRLSNMIKDRHDWCISRQRAWGVPLPIIYCEDKTPIIDKEVFDHYIKLFKEYGSNVWFEKSELELLPEGYKNEHSPNNIYKKETDIMDVWFDSGSSSIAVLPDRDLPYPADLYLEGSDQYRGWFNSSIIVGTAFTGLAPYKAVVSHGFTLDPKGNKMSKSLGNTVDPNKVCNQYGADILRLWVASTDYEADMRLGDEILKQVAENYRKIRNTLRFIDGNLSNGSYGRFNKEKDYQSKLEFVDELILNKLHEIENDVLDAYDNYSFNTVTTKILNFFTGELSSFYLDITKDILYCEDVDSIRRKQVQTVLYELEQSFVRLLNPILPFTMDELYSLMGEEKENVQLLDIVKRTPVNDDLSREFDLLMKLRVPVLKCLEQARAEGIIGSAQEALVSLEIDDEEVKKVFDKLSKIEKERFFIVSELKECSVSAESNDGVKVLVSKHTGEKCQRCWNRFEHLDENCMCERCAKVYKHYSELEDEQ